MADEEILANTPENKPPLPPGFEAAMWKPGQSGNPNGRPKKKPLSELYEKMLNDPQMIGSIESAIKQAISKGSMAMVLQLKEMGERTEGKVVQPVDGDLNINLNLSLSDRMEKARERSAGS